MPSGEVDRSAYMESRAVEDVQTRVAKAFYRADRLDPLLGSYLARFPEGAATTAAELDSADVETRPLHGVLIGVKDIVATREGR